jgi:hypothetical protein
MNCHEFQEQDGGMIDHLRECSACAARYARQQQLRAGLRALAAKSQNASAPSRVERRLVAAFRAQTFSSVPRRPGWMPLMLWATAQAATVLAGFVLLQGRQPQRTPHISRNTVEVAAADPGGTVESVTLREGYEDFIPLPDAEGIAPNEAVNVVRVEVPRSAMIPLGYAVSEENASETVEADVVLGSDGLARAVRFLNEAANF